LEESKEGGVPNTLGKARVGKNPKIKSEKIPWRGPEKRIPPHFPQKEKKKGTACDDEKTSKQWGKKLL